MAAELKITIDSKEELFGIHVITINPERRINSIKAFIRESDK
jgi:hypothetical protein